jgi:hypothetical protein
MTITSRHRSVRAETPPPRSPFELDPRAIARALGYHAPLPPDFDADLCCAIGGQAMRFLVEHPDATPQTVGRFGHEFFATIRDVEFRRDTLNGRPRPISIGEALFKNLRVPAPIAACTDFLRVFLAAGDVRSTLIKQRDELDAAIAEIDRLTAARGTP